MMEGVLRHCTSAEIDRNYVDSHGQSAVGFAFAHLLGFKLLPRLKNIGSQRLYRPDDGPAPWDNLSPVLTRPIPWDVIAQQYDQIVKYATALKLHTAEAEQVLRRFHPARPPTPHLRRARRAGTGGADGVPRRVPPVANAGQRGPRGPPGRGALELGERLHPLRPGLRATPAPTTTAKRPGCSPSIYSRRSWST